MVDRKARDELATLLRAYMDEKITAFEFDDKMWEIADNSKDDAVFHVSGKLWHFYDDCTDHRVVASKEVWDIFNRSLLLLDSDAEVVLKQSRWHWSVRQLIAAACLAAFVVVAVKVGWSPWLWICMVPLGLASIRLARWNGQANSQWRQNSWALAPFPTFGSLMAVRRLVADFGKRRYRPTTGERTIRCPAKARFTDLFRHILWIMYSPAVLLIQVFPDREDRIDIVPPEAARPTTVA